jgi:hypothetical protein
MSLRSITAEVAATQGRERAAAAAAATATATRAARLAAAELAAARAEVKAAEAADADRAAAAELEVMRGSSVDSSVSGDGSTNDELRLAREAAQEHAAQWAAAHPHGGARGGSPDGRGHADGAPDGGGWVDGGRGLYRRRRYPSPDRYHGHRGVQAVVRDIGPGGGWPTLPKTNYVEWAAVMWVWLQVRHMWEAVRYGDVDYYEDRRALDALIAAVPPEMQFLLSQKQTAKEAWDAIIATVLARPHYRHFARSGRTWPSSQVRMLMTLLFASTLLQKMVQFGDDTYDEDRAVEKLFRCIPEKYKQITRSIDSLLDPPFPGLVAKLAIVVAAVISCRLLVVDGAALGASAGTTLSLSSRPDLGASVRLARLAAFAAPSRGGGLLLLVVTLAGLPLLPSEM